MNARQIKHLVTTTPSDTLDQACSVSEQAQYAAYDWAIAQGKSEEEALEYAAGEGNTVLHIELNRARND